MGKRGISRKGTRFAVVFAFAVLGSSALGGVASAAPSRSACSGRTATAACAPTSPHHTRITTTSTDAADVESASAETETVVADAPAQTVSKPATASAPTVVKGTSSVKRADHKHGSSAPSGGVDPDCGDDDIGDAPDGGDDDEDCDSGSSEEPCEEDDDDADDDDDGDDEGDEDECSEPTPAPEVCGDGIDNDKDGQVDEGCVLPETPEPPVKPEPPTAPAPTVVLPKTFKTLPKTGADVSTLFLIGMAMVAAGGATRIRTRPWRVVFAGQGSVAELVLVQYLNHVATHRVLRPPRR